MTDDNQKDLFGPKPLGDLMPIPTPKSRVQRRAIKASIDIQMDSPKEIAYQHTVLCQTSMPYRNPGNNVRVWDREQGNVSLRINAGDAKNPDTGEWIELGLPFGPKPRLILSHLNAEALKQDSPVVEVEDSLTAFVRRVIGRYPAGPDIRAFKDHLGRLSASTIRLAIATDERALQVNSQIVEAFELWFSKNEQQRVLWPSTIYLNERYFASLQKHAVPLDERALGALSHSSMALDIYTWLAQRLHRIPEGRPQFIPWTALKDQFGQGYTLMKNFKRAFRVAIKQVLIQYTAANIEGDNQGLTLRNSSPPISSRLFLVNKP